MVMKDASSISRTKPKTLSSAGHQDAGVGNGELAQPSDAGDRRVLGDDPGEPARAHTSP